MNTARHISLSESAPAPRIQRVLSSRVSPNSLTQAGQQSWVTVTRAGTFTDPRYGQFSITPLMLSNMVKQFEAGAVGTDIFFDVSHEPDKGAAAKIQRLSVEGNRLRALVEWTEYGIEAVKKRGFRYLSAEYHENWQGNEVGVNDTPHGAVLLGAGLTVRPVIKGLDPVTLSVQSRESDTDNPKHPFIVHPDLAQKLLTEAKNTMNALEKLLAKINLAKIPEASKTSLKTLAETQFKGVDDADKAKALADVIGANVDALVADFAEQKKLAQPAAGAEPKQPEAQPKILSEKDIADLVTKQLAQTKADADATQKTLSEKRTLLTTTINAAEGLDDGLKKDLADAATSFVTADMNDAQVKALAQMQIDQGNKVVAARTLSNMGYTVGGTPHIHVVDEGAMKISQIYIDKLKQTNSAGALQLDAKAPIHPFCAKVLSEFDRMNGIHLEQELKVLAAGAGTTDIGNTQLPVGVVREVIRQALSDLNVLALVQNLTDFSAQATTQIPYEVRDTSQIANDGIVYENSPIPFAGITQAMELAFVTPMKLALSITNEVAYFSRTSAINWDAVGRNIESNARIMRELIARRICNEIQRASDSYLAVNVANEVFTTQLGTKNTIKTAGFPIVAPFQARDLQGTIQGVAKNAITITLNSTVINPFDGTGKQAAGTYYKVLNYNLGLIQFVNQLGATVTPANTGTNTISYSRATNVAMFDLDVPAGTTSEKWLNGLVRAVGTRKAMMETRFNNVDFMLMSPTLNDTITNAEQFVATLKRNGSDTTSEGDLQSVKSVPAYKTNAPGINLGDDRIIMGRKGTTAYTVAKPYSIGEMIEAMDTATGRPLGKKIAYGEEYNVVATPNAVCDRYTSVIAYSSAARNAI